MCYFKNTDSEIDTNFRSCQTLEIKFKYSNCNYNEILQFVLTQNQVEQIYTESKRMHSLNKRILARASQAPCLRVRSSDAPRYGSITSITYVITLTLSRQARAPNTREAKWRTLV